MKIEDFVKLRLSGDYNLPLLSEELFEAFPHWREEIRNGKPATSVTLAYETVDEISLRYPPSTSEEDVLAVIEAHNPKDKSRNEKADARRIVSRKSAIVKLKALGLTNDELEALGL